MRNSLAIVQLQQVPELRWLMRNNLAWADFRIRRDELREEADTRSAAEHARWAVSRREKFSA